MEATFVKTQKQIEATTVMASCRTSLLEGGARAGKTVIIMRNVFVRALHYPGSWHLAARLRLAHARTSLWKKTIPEVLYSMGMRDGNGVALDHRDMTVRVFNKDGLE